MTSAEHDQPDVTAFVYAARNPARLRRLEVALWGCVDAGFLENAIKRALAVLGEALADHTYFAALAAVNEQLDREGYDPISAICFSDIITSLSIAGEILLACPAEATA